MSFNYKNTNSHYDIVIKEVTLCVGNLYNYDICSCLLIPICHFTNSITAALLPYLVVQIKTDFPNHVPGYNTGFFINNNQIITQYNAIYDDYYGLANIITCFTYDDTTNNHFNNSKLIFLYYITVGNIKCAILEIEDKFPYNVNWRHPIIKPEMYYGFGFIKNFKGLHSYHFKVAYDYGDFIRFDESIEVGSGGAPCITIIDDKCYLIGIMISGKSCLKLKYEDLYY